LVSLLPIPSLWSSPLSQWSSHVSAFSNLLLHITEIFCVWLTHRPDDGGSKLLRKVGQYLPDYTMQQKTTIFILTYVSPSLCMLHVPLISFSFSSLL
jgi:hypothetical protein